MLITMHKAQALACSLFARALVIAGGFRHRRLCMHPLRRHSIAFLSVSLIVTVAGKIGFVRLEIET